MKCMLRQNERVDIGLNPNNGRENESKCYLNWLCGLNDFIE